MSVKRKKSKIELIIEEVAYDLGIDKKLVRKVVMKSFAEIVCLLVFKKRSVMIRGIAKFVVSKGLDKSMKLKDIMKLKTKNK